MRELVAVAAAFWVLGVLCVELGGQFSRSFCVALRSLLTLNVTRAV